MRGKFIVIEGIDGSGKTTQCKAMVELLCSRGHSATMVQDPGSSKLGTALRPLLLDKSLEMTVDQQAVLFTAARMATADVVRGHLEAGTHVIADRWILSTVIYQGVLGGCKFVVSLQNLLVQLFPDLYVVLDVPADVAIARAKAAGDSTNDRFESRPLEWWEELRTTYRNQAALRGLELVDGVAQPEVITQEIAKRFDRTGGARW